MQPGAIRACEAFGPQKAAALSSVTGLLLISFCWLYYSEMTTGKRLYLIVVLADCRTFPIIANKNRKLVRFPVHFR